MTRNVLTVENKHIARTFTKPNIKAAQVFAKSLQLGFICLFANLYRRHGTHTHINGKLRMNLVADRIVSISNSTPILRSLSRCCSQLQLKFESVLITGLFAFQLVLCRCCASLSLRSIFVLAKCFSRCFFFVWFSSSFAYLVSLKLWKLALRFQLWFDEKKNETEGQKMK